ncbi:MAG: hypothetical protein J7K72_03620 [Candidatus Aenigmarchaeota archaeon]|nr:hypothetical protein [Candidatus Aenigmarchaeota archaeon]
MEKKTKFVFVMSFFTLLVLLSGYALATSFCSNCDWKDCESVQGPDMSWPGKTLCGRSGEIGFKINDTCKLHADNRFLCYNGNFYACERADNVDWDENKFGNLVFASNGDKKGEWTCDTATQYDDNGTRSIGWVKGGCTNFDPYCEEYANGKCYMYAYQTYRFDVAVKNTGVLAWQDGWYQICTDSTIFNKDPNFKNGEFCVNIGSVDLGEESKISFNARMTTSVGRYPVNWYIKSKNSNDVKFGGDTCSGRIILCSGEDGQCADGHVLGGQGGEGGQEEGTGGYEEEQAGYESEATGPRWIHIPNGGGGEGGAGSPLEGRVNFGLAFDTWNNKIILCGG